MSIRMAQLENANKRLTQEVQRLNVELAQCRKELSLLPKETIKDSSYKKEKKNEAELGKNWEKDKVR